MIDMNNVNIVAANMASSVLEQDSFRKQWKGKDGRNRKAS